MKNLDEQQQNVDGGLTSAITSDPNIKAELEENNDAP